MEASVGGVRCHGCFEDEVLTINIKEGARDEECRKLLEGDEAWKWRVI